jgi:hypothetical protein
VGRDVVDLLGLIQEAVDALAGGGAVGAVGVLIHKIEQSSLDYHYYYYSFWNYGPCWNPYSN